MRRDQQADPQRYALTFPPNGPRCTRRSQFPGQEVAMSVPSHVISGFDSAWTAQNKGAIASIQLSPTGELAFVEPECCTFADAPEVLERHRLGSRHQLLALDQPMFVDNSTGRRPVEDLVSPLIGRLKSGMQPANLSRTDMFGQTAPIEAFRTGWKASGGVWLSTPEAAIGQDDGLQVIEVYPALALAGLGLVIADGNRERLPKYNPARRSGDLPSPTRKRLTPREWDWRFVCLGIADEWKGIGLPAAEKWCRDGAELARPRKHDQDKLDAVICALVGYLWWRHGTEHCTVFGDEHARETGYIVAPSRRKFN